MKRVIKYIVIHCTAGSQVETIPQLIKGFRSRGWKNNGYHIVIDGDGLRHDITDIEKIANGVAGHNANSIHISYMGGVNMSTGKSEDNRTDKQKAMLLFVIRELRIKYPKAKILGHRDLSPDKNKNGSIEKFEWLKACPSFDAVQEYKSI
jgi:N-acetylmuramoyl-L-alanine amidase